jgi:BirA family biotin operon repressor/biotin-[acetyl-CoA-carboxylase] ligase
VIDAQRLLNETFVADVENYDILASTQDRARAAAGDPKARLPLLVVAGSQTAGRGRGTNRWWTGHGSLAFSLVLERTACESAGTTVPQVSLAVAVALVDAIQHCAGGLVLGLHWPNDIFIGERKLAGILVDVLAGGRYVIGVGINTNNSAADAPEELRERAATLRDLTGNRFDHTDVLVALLRELAETLRELAENPDRVGRRFDELCLQHGQALTLRAGRETVCGVCEGIAPDGALLIATDGGRRRCYSGTLR